MSISELEARIEGISTEIERQKEVLKELVHTKCLAQRQLNALRDPLARLPVEISSEIFLRCLPIRPSPGVRHFPTLLLTICHAWASIALSLPALWAGISIDLSEAEGLETTVANWLNRTRGHPLDVYLLGETNNPVAALIWQHSGQLRSLDINFEDFDTVTYEYREEEYRPLGDSGLQNPLPSLHTLVLSGQIELHCSWLPIHTLLSLAPNLVELELNDMSLDDVASVEQQLVLSNLRRLEISGYFPREWHTDILRWFSTPRLENLSLPPRSILSNEFLPFLQRSAPLQLFRCADSSSRRANIQLQPILELMPTLAHLELNHPSTDVQAELFNILAQDLLLLPNLASLSLTNTEPPDDSVCNILVRALSARRHKLRTIRITGTREGIQGSEETLAALRALLADGMDIHIGSGPNVLLSA